MSQALYRKYRSKSLDEIVGQDHITGILKRAINSGKVAHAYLLTGPRGVGKTSIARILAHEINHLPYVDESTHLDIIEIDAASNNSVEDIRDLREKAQIAPVSAAKKIYIIDEVHMLSKQAFNALLKTLEEPPEHIVFILATTDADKLPATIISRVQRFNFRTINEADAVKHLHAIAKDEHIDIDDDALALIAAHGKGSFRDSISLLDQLQSLSDGAISRDAVESVLGLAEADTIQALLGAYENGDIATIVSILDTAEARGIPAHIITEQLIREVRLSIATNPDRLPLLDALLDVSKSMWPDIKLLTALTSRTDQTSTPKTAKPQPKPPKPSAPEKAPAKEAAKDKPSDEPKKATKPEKAPTPAHTETDTTVSSASMSDDIWKTCVDTLKEQGNAGIAALLASCGYEQHGDKLTIYAGKKFTKARLDKTIAAIVEALSSAGCELEIDIVAEPKPPKDSETAAIVAMMGGGEEVDAVNT